MVLHSSRDISRHLQVADKIHKKTGCPSGQPFFYVVICFYAFLAVTALITATVAIVRTTPIASIMTAF